MLAWLFHEEMWRCSTVIEALHKPERVSITPTVFLGCLEPVLWTGDYSADLVTGCLLQHPAWSRKRPAAPVDAQCLCFLLFPSPAGCSAILPSNLLFFLLHQVFSKLLYPIVREGALSVLQYMLLSFQHSHEAFHLVRLSLALG